MKSNLARLRRIRKGKKLARRILGVGEQASSGEMKHAWRTMCKKHHPDRHEGGESTRRFRLARQAYRCLRWSKGCERLLEMEGAAEAADDMEEDPGNRWAYFLWWRENFF